MWILTKESSGLLWLELESGEHVHFILPIFTNPDTAINFIGDINHNGEIVHMQHIDTIDKLNDLILIIEQQPASAIILNPPNPEVITRNDKLIYWSNNEFGDLIKPLLAMNDYEEHKVIEILNRYLEAKDNKK